MWQYNKYKKKKATTKTTDSVKVKKEPDLTDKLDKVFSLYIRLRDAMPNGMIRCISCGQIKEFSKFDCGHYWSRSHIGTRWDEDNCNAECAYCNRMTGGEHMIGYRENLIKKIGQQRFDLLEVKAREYSDLKKDKFKMQLLIKYYQNKVKELLNVKQIKK